MIFVGISLKFKKSWPNFFKFQSISILAIGSNKQQQAVSMPKYSMPEVTKRDHYFLYELKARFSFLKESRLVA